MLIPTPKHYKKPHVIFENKESALYQEHLKFGFYGIVALHSGYISPEELESVRRVCVRTFRNIRRFYKKYLKKTKINSWLKVWLRAFAFHSLTSKPKQARMGKGKGKHDCWVYPVICGKILLEVNVPSMYAYKLLEELKSKLSVKSKIIKKKL